MLVDAKGAKPGVLFGSLMLGVGYYSLHGGESGQARPYFEDTSNIYKHMRLGLDPFPCLGCASLCLSLALGAALPFLVLSKLVGLYSRPFSSSPNRAT